MVTIVRVRRVQVEVKWADSLRGKEKARREKVRLLAPLGTVNVAQCMPGSRISRLSDLLLVTHDA